jgi:hypothetical protein
MDFERLRDIPYLLQVLADSGQPMEVRVHVLRRLRSRPVTAGDRSTVAGALRHLMSTDANSNLRLQAVLALGAFTDINSVLSVLGSLAMEPEESIDLRYSASATCGIRLLCGTSAAVIRAPTAYAWRS